MKIPLPTQIMLEASDIVTRLLVDRRAARSSPPSIAWRVYTRTAAGRLWWDGARLQDPAAGRRAAQGRDRPLRPRHGDAGGEHRAAGAIASGSPPPR